MLHEVVVDTALDAHERIKRNKGACGRCGKQCKTHTLSAWQAGGGAGPKSDYYSNNPLFECLVCSRQVSSNRYATHLEKCMGMGLKAPRKTATRTAKAAAATRAPARETPPRKSEPSTKRNDSLAPAPKAKVEKAVDTPAAPVPAPEKQAAAAQEPAPGSDSGLFDDLDFSVRVY